MKVLLKYVVLAMMLVSVFALVGCKDDKVVFNQIDSICELATLECYYHNVAEYEFKGDGFLANWTSKKAWIEYSGIAKIGIDASRVDTGNPDKKGVVTVKIPKAKILSVDLDKESIKEGVTDIGTLPILTTEDKIEALAEAQKSMYDAVSSDTTLLYQGQKRAKMIIEKYIINVGNQLGKHFEVNWVEIE